MLVILPSPAYPPWLSAAWMMAPPVITGGMANAVGVHTHGAAR